MSSQLWWYVARSGGIVALALAGLSVFWGLLYSTRVLNGRPTAKWLLDLHRFLGAATLVFTGIHMGALMLDGYVEFGWVDLLVPYASTWNPGAVALGIVAMYLLVAVELTSLVMRRIPRKWWRAVHLSSFGLLWAGLVHGVMAGTDATQPIYVLVASLMLLAVLYLVMVRILGQRKLLRRSARAVPSRPAEVT